MSPDVVENPVQVLVERLEAPKEAAPSATLSTADAAAIIAWPLTVGFGLFAVVVSVSDPLAAAIWAVAATIATVMVMRYGNRAIKIIAAWIANLDENDTNQ